MDIQDDMPRRLWEARCSALRCGAMKFGDIAKFAQELGVSRQAVAAWQQIPAHHVRRVSELTGIPDYVLRPDLYRRPEGRDA